MTATAIKTLFANNIERRIEEVIKVDQTTDEILRDEMNEYVVTDAIRKHYSRVFDAYAEMPNKPNEGIAIWVSGFFGSGKSSFAKMLGLAISNRSVAGEPASVRFGRLTGDNKVKVLLSTIAEKIPTHAVIFDVSTDRGIKSGNQTLTEIMYRLFLSSLDYSKDLDLSELEIALEGTGQLDRFKAEYEKEFKKSWDKDKDLVAFSLGRASRIMSLLEPTTYPHADSWVKGVKDKADISPGKLAERATELMKRRRPGKSLIFVVDEVGQFVARDIQKMLDLQAVVQQLGVKGRGKHWVVVTSQEKLGELVSGLDEKKIELARLMDRFPEQVHLEPSDISEVTSRRVLSKNAGAEATLGKLYDDHRGSLADHTRLKADIKLPELTRESFIALYPLLPYQIDLIIQVVSGLRTQAGASKHVGGANRTIIKLAQQLLINPAVALADQPVGALVRIDQVYDLVEGNIGSEIRGKISAIKRELNHPLAQAVAKAICLLQYVKTIHRTAENIAAALHPGVAADSQLAAVKEALQELESSHNVRRGDDGYRIPTPAEDDWERVRFGLKPKPNDTHRLLKATLATFWQPQPQHTLLDTKPFKAGLMMPGGEIEAGDITFHLQFADDQKEFEAVAKDLRARSQQERKTVFWAVQLTDALDHEAVEMYRSKEMLERKERETKGEDTPALIAEERVRLRRHTDEVRRLLKAACLSGHIYFRGNDRSPRENVDVGRTASDVLGQVLPDVFDRFKEAAAKTSELKKGVDALFVAENLQGLPAVFSGLGLLRDEKNKTVFRVEGGPLKEVLDRIEAAASYGNTSTGRQLADEFAKEPFGWDFDAVRLLVLALIRAGKLEATSKGQTFDSLGGVEAKETFSNNNIFKQASFRPRKGPDFAETIKAADAYSDVVGEQIRDASNARPVAEAIRAAMARGEDSISSSLSILSSNQLPGGATLESALGQVKAIRRAGDDATIASFNASYRGIKEAIKRSAELQQALTEPRLHDLDRAKTASGDHWAFLQEEPNLPEELKTKAGALRDLLARETFFKELPTIDQHTSAIDAEYERRYSEALTARVAACSKAYDQLIKTPGWTEVDESHQRRLIEPFERGRQKDARRVPIPQVRADRDACDGRLRAAVAELRKVIDGERSVSVNVSSYFGAGVENEEQLDAALSGVREECARLIGAGKKVIVQ